MMDEIIKTASSRMDKAVADATHQFGTVRTGRASVAIFENVMVEVYGSSMPLNQVASVRAPEATSALIEPWDKSTLGAIEKAILSSDLGLNPSNDGNIIRVPFPSLNEERRRELVKLTKHYAEEHRVAVRNVRRDAIDQLKKSEKEHEISQDDLKRAEDEVQKLTDAHIKRIDEALKHKEAEIMEV
jgi:ribosome recycling factor